MKINKLVCLLISLVAAVVLWGYVVTVISPEKTTTIYDIPVTFSGEDVLSEQNLTISKGKDVTVNLQITGKRTVVQQLNSDNITVTVDVSKIKAAGDFSRNYTITYPNSIQQTSLSVDRKSPSTVSFTVAELVKVEVPVKTVFQGSLADGYMLENITPAYNSVTVTGTKEQVSDLTAAMIYLNAQNLSSTTTADMSYTLVNSNGESVSLSSLKVDVESVSVTMSVVKFKEVPLSVAFTPGGGATESNVTLTVNPTSVMVSGDEKTLASLDKIVLGTVDLSKIDADTTMTYPIVLPDNVKNESGVVEATATISVSGLSSKTIKASTFEFQNVPAGFAAQAVTKTLQIKVRGPASEIAALTAADAKIVVDLSSISAVAGTYTIDKVTVSLNGKPNSGILGTYSVAVSLAAEKDYTAEAGQ